MDMTNNFRGINNMSVWLAFEYVKVNNIATKF